ncbi:hypothetical protein N665_0256s0016 [Sinapis alba]|nr:hypothetical protein N665_0256s0016 [Sinapis alba]
MSYGDCRISKHDIRTSKKLTYRPLHGMRPVCRVNGLGRLISCGRYITQKNRHNTPNRLELRKFCTNKQKVCEYSK